MPPHNPIVLATTRSPPAGLQASKLVVAVCVCVWAPSPVGKRRWVRPGARLPQPTGFVIATRFRGM